VLTEREQNPKYLGDNECLDSAVRALRYLANNSRPPGGQSLYNTEHLLQIADEVEKEMLTIQTTLEGM
jgi:hypothetical protein